MTTLEAKSSASVDVAAEPLRSALKSREPLAAIAKVLPQAMAGLLALVVLAALSPQGMENGLWEGAELHLAKAAVDGPGSSHTHPLAVQILRLALRVFGNHEWALRIPAFVFALAAVALVGVVILRHEAAQGPGKAESEPVSVRLLPALLGGLSLLCMPIFVTHMRLASSELLGILGAGLSLVSLAWTLRRLHAGRSGAFPALCAVPALVFGIAASGVLFGAALPLLSVGLGALRLEPTAPSLRRLRIALVAVGFVLVAVALYRISRSETAGYSVWMGGVYRKVATSPAWDAGLGDSLYATWPFGIAAVAAVFGREKLPDLRVSVGLTFVCLVWVVRTGFAPWFVELPYVEVLSLSVLFGIGATRSEDIPRRASFLWTTILLLLTLLVARDLVRWPDRLASALVERATMPSALIGNLRYGAVLVAICAGLYIMARYLPIGRTYAQLAAFLLVGATVWVRWTMFPPLALAHSAPSSGASLLPGRVVGALRFSNTTALLAGYSGPTALESPASAVHWLMDGQDRSLVLRQAELAETNAQYRARTGQNLFLRQASLGETFVVDHPPDPLRANQNPLERIVSSAMPSWGQCGDPKSSGKLTYCGLSFTRSDGRGLSALDVPRSFRARILYRVDETIQGYCTFIHIDHRAGRFAHESREWEKYPMRLWRPGEFVVDEHEVTLGPHFGPGKYTVYIGVGELPCHDDKRLRLAGGRDDGQGRIVAGEILFR